VTGAALDVATEFGQRNQWHEEEGEPAPSLSKNAFSIGAALWASEEHAFECLESDLESPNEQHVPASCLLSSIARSIPGPPLIFSAFRGSHSGTSSTARFLIGTETDALKVNFQKDGCTAGGRAITADRRCAEVSSAWFRVWR
jgi:hypothetical protein